MKRINLKKINFDDIKNKVNKFFIEHRLITMSLFTFILLACVTFLISYAYYKVLVNEEIIGTKIGEIPDIDVRILVEDRNSDGSAIKGKYIEYPYVPQAGYEYNDELSYCTNGSKLKYYEGTHSVAVDTTGTDLCFAYFDSIANLDIVLNVEIEEINDIGEGTGSYHRIDSADMPAVGYTMASSECSNGATISYNLDENRFIILTDSKTVCNVRMDAIPADVILKLKVQDAPSSNNYVEVKELPTNQYYNLNGQSHCTNDATLSIVNQEVVVKATKRTVCEAFLDLAEGPIAESASISTLSGKKVLSPVASSIGTPINSWYYSLDDGDNYQALNDGVINGEITDKVLVYGEDAAGNKSSLMEVDSTNEYYYQGFYEAQDTVYEKVIEKSGYYYLQGWGASETENYNLGSYAEGYIYLEKNDKLYINVGKMPSGNTTIKVNQNDDNHQVLIAGGVVSSYVYSEELASIYPGTSNLNSKYYLQKGLAYNKYELFKSTVGLEEAGHNGDGYVKVTYIGETLGEE